MNPAAVGRRLRVPRGPPPRRWSRARRTAPRRSARSTGPAPLSARWGSGTRSRRSRRRPRCAAWPRHRDRRRPGRPRPGCHPPDRWKRRRSEGSPSSDTSPDLIPLRATQHEVGGGDDQIGLGELNVVVATGRQDVRRPGHQGDQAVLRLFVDGVECPRRAAQAADVSPPNGSVLVRTTTGTCGKAGGARVCAALASRSTRSDSGVRIDAIGMLIHRHVQQLVAVDRPAVAEGRGNRRD